MHLGAPEARAAKELEPLSRGTVGSMSRSWREWRRVGAPRKVVQWLRQGVPIRWASPPPRWQEAPPQQNPEINRELSRLVEAGAFTPFDRPLVSPTFLIPKKSGGTRLIHDLRGVNASIVPPRFTLRGAAEAAGVTRDSNWLVALDLAQGYQQVAVAEEARRYLGAMWGDRAVAATVLPFGLNLSPYVFTRITGFLARLIRKRLGLNVACYIDDFLLGADTREALVEGLAGVRSLFRRLGVVLSDKLPAVPAQTADFLGFRWDARTKEVQIPEERRAAFKQEVQYLLSGERRRAHWLRTIGRLLFLREACPVTLRHIRSLLHVVRGRGRRTIEARGEAREDLEWWREALSRPLSLPLQVRPVSAALVTDASDAAVGFSISAPGCRVSGTRPVEDGRVSINAREIEAIYKGLERGAEALKGRRVVVYSDNTTACAAVAKQGTQRLSQAAWDWTKKVVDKAEALGVQLVPHHVPGRLNAEADALSRPGEARDAWEEAMRKITSRWGPLQEDPFGWMGEATSLPEACSWASRRTLLKPPTRHIREMLELVSLHWTGKAPRGSPVTWERMAVVLVPTWKGAPWWPRLMRLQVASISLGRLPDRGLSRWRAANGHWPRWSAWLVPLQTPCGPRQRGGPMQGTLSAGSDGSMQRAGRKGLWRTPSSHISSGLPSERLGTLC